jgi:hypothetical protein
MVYLLKMMIFYGYVSHNQLVHIMFRFRRLSPGTSSIFDGLKQQRNSQLASHPGVILGPGVVSKLGTQRAPMASG